jgi:sugar phosphate isomerase/epimerase
MNKRRRILRLGVVLLLFTLAQAVRAGEQTAIPQLRHISPEIQTNVEMTDYQGVRIKKFPIAVQSWTFRRLTFFETLDKLKELGIRYVQAYPGQALAPELPNARFNHNMTDEQVAKVKDKLRETGVALVAYGVVGGSDFGRTEESMRKIFDFARKMGFRMIVTEPEDNDFTLLEKLVKEYDIMIAIHNHPPGSKYSQPETVFNHVNGKDPRIGSCADTGHWMRGMNNPLEALKLLEGLILDVHLKDRSGFGTQGVDDVPWGQGQGRIHDILAELTLQDYGGFLTIEYENEKEVANPIPAIEKSVAYVKSITYYEGYDQIFKKSGGHYEKHGWNHYGPGYFEVDEKAGMLKGQGGMGLLWYSQKKYKDFILELDYKCAQKNTNSGIFIRVPEVPTSDDYIYHSFEIQIYDAGQDIHKTGAVYDVEAPTMDAFFPAGQWNHMKIEFRGNHLKIELNGKTIIDWDARPGGKVKDFSLEGYVGLQNHDSAAPVYFRNIYIKEL